MPQLRPWWLLLPCLACTPAAAPPPVPAATPRPVADAADRGLAAALDEAAEGVSSPALRELLRDHWRWTLESDPIRATRLGVHDFDAQLAIPDAAHLEAQRARRRELLGRAQALEVEGQDAVTRALLVSELEAAVAREGCRFEHWSLNPRHNAVTIFNRLPEDHRVSSGAEVDALIARYRLVPKVIDAEIANLRIGRKEGLFAPAETLRRVLSMVETQLGQPLDDWPMLSPLKEGAWPADAGDERATRLHEVVAQEVKPAFQRYGALLRDLVKEGRPADQTGLSALPFGEACYAARLKAFSTLELSAAQIHDIGRAAIAATDAELADLGASALKTEDLASTLKRLREDPKLRFSSEEEVETAARSSLAAAKAKMGAYFGLLPQADCVVRRIPDYEAPFTTIAYYRPPHADGSKPGEYFINVHAPTTRPRYEARVLAVHEAIPGHHLQIAIAQELGTLPAFRKHGGFTAFVEGWALYTERLGEEMGLYRDDLDRIGVASFDAWRAGRLVVDTGIHALGWSREQAEAYLLEHTALAAKNVENEIDRYIAWPGQAVAYKLGQRELVRLRRGAEEALGDRFELPAFHDVVLEGGAVSLPVLRARVERWVEERQSKTTP